MQFSAWRAPLLAVWLLVFAWIIGLAAPVAVAQEPENPGAAASTAAKGDDADPQDKREARDKIPARRETVVVTGTFEPIPLGESERAISVLDITEAPLLFNTFVDYLKLDPSLDLRQRGQNGIQGDLSIRGGTFGQTLILLDGVRMNDAQSGHHNLNLPIPMEALESVEVLRGSGSTLYGADAVGGVVNFRTRRPEASEIRFRGGLGNFGANQQRVMASLARGPLFQQLTASRDFSTGFIENRDYRNAMISSSTHLKTSLGFTRVLLAMMDRPFGAQGFYGRFNSWERTKGWTAMGSQELGSRTIASFSYRRHTDLFVLYRDRPQVYTNHHISQTWLGSLRRTDDVGAKGRLHYGVEALHDDLRSNNLGMHNRGRQSAYVNYDLRAAGRFSFTAGTRYELFRAWSGQLSPTLATGFWLSSHAKLRASVSRAYRVPSFTDLYYHDPANRGNPDLRPERAWGYEAGLDWNAGQTVDGEVTVFQRRERDGIDFVRDRPDAIWQARNFQRLRFTGLEARARWRYRPAASAEIAYTGLRGAQTALEGMQSRYTFNYPVHAVVGSWQAVTRGDLALRTRLGVTQRFQRASYFLWDVSVAHHGRRLRPFLQVSNLTSTTYEEIPGVPMPGRGVIGGLELVVWTARQ
ncbi:MAG: TonB-dependent receptor [Bryobacterales bacterium]|jgi:iron complex outermembrane receptor protein|nr:TonB-dependent receptor [Bryobacterales bacterium]